MNNLLLSCLKDHLFIKFLFQEDFMENEMFRWKKKVSRFMTFFPTMYVMRLIKCIKFRNRQPSFFPISEESLMFTDIILVIFLRNDALK